MINFILGVIAGAAGLYIYRNGWNVFRVRIAELVTLARLRGAKLKERIENEVGSTSK